MSTGPQIENVSAPKELRELRGWLVWRFETYPGESKPRKIPYYVSGGKRRGHQGSDADRACLTTFEVARDAAVAGEFSGVGFAPMPEFNITALDFDKCIDANGKMPDEVSAIVSNTYAEYSPSGVGVRAFLRGNLGNHKSPATDNQFGFETFSSTGFVTFTGNPLDGTELLGLENTIAPVASVAEALCRRRFGEDRHPQGAAGDDPFAGLERPIGLTIDRMTELLAQLDPDMGRDDWIKVGMALHFECSGDDTGLALWDEWSAGGGKYPSEEGVRVQWESFNRPRQAGRKPVTMASVMRMVKLAGQAAAAPQAATAEEVEAAVAETPAGDPDGDVATPDSFGGKYPMVSASALSQRPTGEWLVKGLIPKADVIVLFGASGSGKSFVALDIAAAIARGVDWRGHRTKKGRVLIIAAEGGGGVGKRLKAYAQHHGLDLTGLDIGIIVAAPNFLQKEEIFEVVSTIRAGGGVDLIIADTFAQVTPGANENAGEDMGLAMGNAKALREATGAPVMLIHHAGKDAARGARGWSGIKAAADAEIEIIKHETGGREIRISKMKDGDDGLQWGFKLEVLTVGRDADGDDITSCVAVPAEVPVPPPEDKGRSGVKSYTKIETLILNTLDTIDKSIAAMPMADFVEECLQQMPEVEDHERDTRRLNVSRTLINLCKGKEGPAMLKNGIVIFYK